MAPTPSFWSRPEGKLGIGIGAILTGGFLWGLYKILPALVSMAQNTLMLGLYVAAISALFYVTVLDSSLRNMLANFYKRGIRALYVLSFNVDPIGGLRERVKELRQRIADTKQRVEEMGGQAQSVRAVMANNQKIIDAGLSRMEAARSRGEQEMATAESIKVGVARQANVQELAPLVERIDKAILVFKDIIKKGSLNIDVMETMVQVKESTYKVAKSTRSALRSAKEALFGDPDKDDLFNMNIRWIDEYSATTMGEMDAVLALNEDAIKSIDLTQMAYSDDAFKLLEERQGRLQHLLVEDDRAKLLLQEGFRAAGQLPAPAVAQPVLEGREFEHLFRK